MGLLKVKRGRWPGFERGKLGVDARSSWNRYTGVAHGSTGSRPVVRSLANGA